MSDFKLHTLIALFMALGLATACSDGSFSTDDEKSKQAWILENGTYLLTGKTCEEETTNAVGDTVIEETSLLNERYSSDLLVSGETLSFLEVIEKVTGKSCDRTWVFEIVEGDRVLESLREENFSETPVEVQLTSVVCEGMCSENEETICKMDLQNMPTATFVVSKKASQVEISESGLSASRLCGEGQTLKQTFLSL